MSIMSTKYAHNSSKYSASPFTSSIVIEGRDPPNEQINKQAHRYENVILTLQGLAVVFIRLKIAAAVSMQSRVSHFWKKANTRFELPYILHPVPRVTPITLSVKGLNWTELTKVCRKGHIIAKEKLIKPQIKLKFTGHDGVHPFCNIPCMLHGPLYVTIPLCTMPFM